MCYRKLRLFKQAKRDYDNLQYIFQKQMSNDVLRFVVKIMMLPA